ncbi:hypothetical protein [Candidatus Palauibacter sp.]|uniref:hypothetical protein n=1 Tax=Candidatus Palauibacter sp. TaxID=3101350 RepID=UPI003B5BBCCA
MPESAGPDRRLDVEALFDRLSRAVSTLGVRVDETRRRAEKAEADYRNVVGALGDSTGSAALPGDLDERLRAVAAENRGLRETLTRARSKAERLRNRLAHVEDEV